MSGITLKSVYKKYDKATKYSVTDFNLEINNEEFVVFVGPSGCGKSTTLRMIAGLEDITSGEIYIGDRLVNDVEPKDRDIAMVFQNYALYPHMTIYDNMAFGLKLRKMPKDTIDQVVRNTAEILGLSEYLKSKPASLSGGERQRVALGRAIVRDPQVFLMDEPLSNLDAKLRVAMRTEISRLHQQLKTTTIYVTHDQTEAMTMADRIVIMKDGFIQQVGSPKEVYNMPQNTFVAGFIGSPAMNLFEVTYHQGIISNDNGFSLPLSTQQSDALNALGYEGKTVIFGIRPEDIYDDIIPLSGNHTIEAEIIVAELLGSETVLYTKSKGIDLTAKVGAQKNYVPHSVIQLHFDLGKCHLFDAATEHVIAMP